MNNVYLNKVNLYISYNKLVRVKGKIAKHISHKQ